MRTGLVGAAALLVAVAAGAGVFPFSWKAFTLENGLRVILVPSPSQGLAAYYSVVRTGSRDEVEPGHSGFAHFFEHMMFRGTEKVAGPEYDRLMTSMGANANAFTSDDVTVYHVSLARADLPQVIELEADRFQHLAYAEREFQTEAGAVYGEYRKGRTSPFTVLTEALLDRAFDVHTYKHTTIGFERDVAAMPTMYAYSRSFFARFYRPDNVVIVVTGDFDEGATEALIRQHYGAWPAGSAAPPVPAEPEQTAERTVEVAYEGRTLPLVAVAWKGERFSPDSRAMVAGALLGELAFGETSDVYRDLVLERRIVQRLIPDFGFNRDPGLWTVLAMVAQEKDIGAVTSAITAAAERFRQAPPSRGRLDAGARRERYAFLMGLDTPDAVAGELVRFVALTGGIEAVGAYFETLASVRPEDVQAAAQRYLAPERRTVAVLKGVAR